MNLTTHIFGTGFWKKLALGEKSRNMKEEGPTNRWLNGLYQPPPPPPPPPPPEDPPLNPEPEDEGGVEDTAKLL